MDLSKLSDAQLDEIYNKQNASLSKDPDIRAAQEEGIKNGQDDSLLSNINNMVNAAADGITGGYADKIAAGLDAIPALFTDEDYSHSYDRHLAEYRARDKAFAEKHPWLSGGSKAAGAAGVAYLTGGASAGAGLLPRIAQGAIEGAGYGALSGAGHTDTGVKDTINNALEGAKTGAIFGGLLPVITKVGGAAYDTAAGAGTGLGRKTLTDIRENATSGVEPAPVGPRLKAYAPPPVPPTKNWVPNNAIGDFARSRFGGTMGAVGAFHNPGLLGVGAATSPFWSPRIASTLESALGKGTRIARAAGATQPRVSATVANLSGNNSKPMDLSSLSDEQLNKIYNRQNGIKDGR